MLLSTLAHPWHVPSTAIPTGRLAILHQTAMDSSKVHAAGALRPRTPVETEALLAYLNGSLELPHAPNFLKATMPRIQRAMLEEFHESHLEVTLTADVAPKAMFRRNMTHNALLAQLFSANADSARGKKMLDRVMDDVELLHFDGIHTLKFVFNSRRITNLYAGLAFRLNGTFIELEDSESGQHAGTFHKAHLRRQYAIRIYWADQLGLVALLSALEQLPGVQVVDAERPCVDSTEVVDTWVFPNPISSGGLPGSFARGDEDSH